MTTTKQYIFTRHGWFIVSPLNVIGYLVDWPRIECNINSLSDTTNSLTARLEGSFLQDTQRQHYCHRKLLQTRHILPPLLFGEQIAKLHCVLVLHESDSKAFQLVGYESLPLLCGDLLILVHFRYV